MANTIRAKVDGELTSRIGSWFTVREIQDKLRINPSTLKPLIMKYAREKLLRRRQVRGTARSVQFTPAARKANEFKTLLVEAMPYRNLKGGATKTAATKNRKASRTTAKRGATTKRNTTKASTTKTTARRSTKRTGRK